MSRGVFNSHNKVGETLTFQTIASSATTFDPTALFTDGSKRPHWNFGDGSQYEAGLGVSYIYGDNGIRKNVTINTNRLSDISGFQVVSDSIIGNVNTTGLLNMTTFNIQANAGVTGVTHSYGQQPLIYNALGCGLIGTLDLTMFPQLGPAFNGQLNASLTRIIHTASTQTFTQYRAFSNGLLGNHDMSMLKIGGDFRIQGNSGLTGITHTFSDSTFTIYYANGDNITGNHDLSMFTGLGGGFRMHSNSNLTGVTHTASTTTFTEYHLYLCDITGNHDMSMLNIGGDFRIYDNLNLTGITHSPSTEVFSTYQAYNCNLIGNHDLSMFTGLGGDIILRTNSGLTGVTHTASTETISSYAINDCDITGELDLSMLSGLGGSVVTFSNTNLSNILFPYTTEDFLNTATINAFTLYDCDLGYVNFLPLSGSNMDVGSTFGSSIDIYDNNMTATEVNHILVDLDTMSSTLNKPGWSGVTMDISGTNASPDSSSGGYDGIAALNSLTGVTNGWTITIS